MAPVTSAVKREHEDDDLTDDSADDSEDDYSMDAQSTGGRGFSRTVGDGAVDYSVTSPGYSSTDSGGASNHAGGLGFSANGASGTPRRATGPRKPRTSQPLSAEEEERRRMRRERNKHAAAKCRQKRVDLTNSLLEETQCLEAEQQKLQEEIKSYQQEKEELEFILEAHRLHCGVDTGLGTTVSSGDASSNHTFASIRSEHHAAPAYALPVVKVEGTSSEPVILQISQTVTGPKILHLQHIPSEASSQVISTTSFSAGLTSSIIGNFVQLPNSGSAELGNDEPVTMVVSTADGSKVQVMHKRPSSLGTKPVWSAKNSSVPGSAGDPLNVFTLGLDSMIDGHTGLTPITGMPAAILATPSGVLPSSSIANMPDGQLSAPENLSSKVSSASTTRSMVTL